jgi:Protein of unknown function (DUF1549)/Protein of unknown function (DUF1553)
MSMGRRFSFLLVLALAACSHAPRTSMPTRATPSPAASKDQARPFGPATIDAALRDEWRRAGVVPAPRADDATFLRRAYVDIAGTVPPADVTVRFLADPSPDKRARLVDALLASPDYAEHWMSYWDDVLMGREARGNLVDRVAFRYWLRGRFAANAPWDRIVSDLVSATGQNGTGGPRVKAPALAVPSMPSAMPSKDGDDDDDDLASINGAVNWTLRFEQNPQDLGGSASRVFLGVRIQCAQCHDHKTESWKQDDFRRFSSAFFRSKVEPIDRGKGMGMVKRVELTDSVAAPPRFAKNAELAPIVRAKATALDGTDLEKGAGTRKALAAWMTSKNNVWFARAFVDRMWAHFLGRGFREPFDDIRPSNPATAPELLDKIAADFTAHDFDIQHLVRTICATEAYNLAASASAKTDPENKLWARFHLVPLGPEELLNALFRVTDLERTAQKAGIKDVEALRTSVVRQYAFVFDTDEENDERDYSGTITQALALLNGALVSQGSRALPGSTVADVANGPGSDAEKLDALALRVLARHATPDERDRWVAHIAGSDARAADTAKSTKSAKGKRSPLDRLSGKRGAETPRLAAYEDVLWGMLNSSEFTFNH